MERDCAIDLFRGVTIVGMVFFTVTLRLSRNLPEILRHNVWGYLHVGDFILPMFLFASGLSLAYYIQKRKKEEKTGFIKNVGMRFGKLALVGILLSFFSASEFLEMDEVMLSAILFIICVMLYRLDWKIHLVIIFLINCSYFVLLHFQITVIFVGHYLGGYSAALYYLPVILVGLMIGKEIISKKVWSEQNAIIILIISVFFIIFFGFIPINKLTVTPSFIMLSILFSFLVFAFIEYISGKIQFGKELEYLGRKPIRYWILMYIIFIIPLWFYIQVSELTLPLSLNWPFGIIISIGLMILFWAISHLIDYTAIIDLLHFFTIVIF
jgi:predicted acyltransferase